MKAHFQTDRGLIRDHNEDCGGIYYNDAEQFLAVIADGMGGHLAGDVASQMAVEWIQQEWEKSAEFLSTDEVEQWMKEIIHQANDEIYKKAQNNEKYLGMGTTVVLAAGVEEEVIIAHIGDSRCYLQSEDELTQITEDHSLVNELIRSGQMSEEDAVHYPRKNIVLKALGTEAQITPDFQRLSWDQGDQLLLCSDGLSDKISHDELASYLKNDECLSEITNQLVDLANERGGEDNITLIIIRNDPGKQAGENVC